MRYLVLQLTLLVSIGDQTPSQVQPFRAFRHHLALFSTIQLHSVSFVRHRSAPFFTILTNSTIQPYSPPFITIWPHRYHSTAFGTFQHHSVSFATIKNHSIPLRTIPYHLTQLGTIGVPLCTIGYHSALFRLVG